MTNGKADTGPQSVVRAREILVIEDEAELLAVVSECLGMYGLKIYGASDGERPKGSGSIVIIQNAS